MIPHARTVHAGRHGPGGARHLTRETGALDSLGSLLDLVLVAAAMGGDHLARSRLHVHCGKPEKRLSPSDSSANDQSREAETWRLKEEIIDSQVPFVSVTSTSDKEKRFYLIQSTTNTELQGDLGSSS